MGSHYDSSDTYLYLEMLRCDYPWVSNYTSQRTRALSCIKCDWIEGCCLIFCMMVVAIVVGQQEQATAERQP